MSALIRARSRILDTMSIRRRCIRRFSSSATESSAERVVAPLKKKNLKYGLLGAGAAILTSAAFTAGYVTLAYTWDQFEDETKRLQSLSKYSAREDTPLVEKVQGSLHAFAMRGAATCAQGYMFLRRLYDNEVIILPDEDKEHEYMLVLDLNETLVFSGWTGASRGWITVKRPGVGDFLHQLSPLYEIVVFSDQFRMYVDPVVERMDPDRCVKYRLSRFDMRFHDGKRYKDFARLKRNPAKIVYITSAPYDKCNLHPQNTVQIQPWKGTRGDTALGDLIPFLRYVAESAPDDVRPLIASYKDRPEEVRRLIDSGRNEDEDRQSEGHWWWRWWRRQQRD